MHLKSLYLSFFCLCGCCCCSNTRFDVAPVLRGGLHRTQPLTTSRRPSDSANRLAASSRSRLSLSLSLSLSRSCGTLRLTLTLAPPFQHVLFPHPRRPRRNQGGAPSPPGATTARPSCTARLVVVLLVARRSHGPDDHRCASARSFGRCIRHGSLLPGREAAVSFVGDWQAVHPRQVRLLAHADLALPAADLPAQRQALDRRVRLQHVRATPTHRALDRVAYSTPNTTHHNAVRATRSPTSCWLRISVAS